MRGNTEAYSAWRAALSPISGCLSLESLEPFAGESSHGFAPEAAAHLAGCPRCQAELAMLRGFESEASPHNEDEREAVAWVTAQMEQRMDRRASQSSALPRMPLRNIFFRSPYPVAAAALAMSAVAIFAYISQTRPLPLRVAPLENQVMRARDVRVTGPSGDLDRPPETFAWEAFPGAAKYSVELLEVDGTLFWKGESAQNFLVTTPALRDRIRPGKSLFWRVVALDASGKILASSSQEKFRVSAGHGDREK